jgi:hypothetical protein
MKDQYSENCVANDTNKLGITNKSWNEYQPLVRSPQSTVQQYFHQDQDQFLY